MSFGLGIGATPVDADSIDASTPWVAASDGNLSLMQTSLTQLQLSCTASDENGYTLLQAAASYSQIDVMKWLLSQRINVNAIDNEGDTALHYATTVDAARFLSEVAKIDTTLKNAVGKSALDCKRDELNELLQDEDNDDQDEDFINLRAVVEYLSSLDANPQ